MERLVIPTLIEPLREEWTGIHGAAFALHEQGKDSEAIRLVAAFQVRLANIRVLDPACGSGNFLYVSLEHPKRLEGEVLDNLESLGQRQTLLALEGSVSIPTCSWDWRSTPGPPPSPKPSYGLVISSGTSAPMDG